MAWMESHQELARHPKTLRLARALGIGLPQAVGHLHFLWWWAMDYAKDGSLEGLEPGEIAAAGGWDGDADAFVSALWSAGFLDEGKRIHDWEQYGGKLAARRAADARRKSEARSNVSATVPADTKPCPVDVPRMSGGQVTESARSPYVEERRGEEKREEKIPPSEGGADAPPAPRPLRPPRKRDVTEEAVREMQEDFPDVDVGACATAYLNHASSKKHTDKVQGLRNWCLKEREFFAERMAANGMANGRGPRGDGGAGGRGRAAARDSADSSGLDAWLAAEAAAGRPLTNVVRG